MVQSPVARWCLPDTNQVVYTLPPPLLLICSGCSNRIPQTKWLINNKNLGDNIYTLLYIKWASQVELGDDLEVTLLVCLPSLTLLLRPSSAFCVTAGSLHFACWSPLRKFEKRSVGIDSMSFQPEFWGWEPNIGFLLKTPQGRF